MKARVVFFTLIIILVTSITTYAEIVRFSNGDNYGYYVDNDKTYHSTLHNLNLQYAGRFVFRINRYYNSMGLFVNFYTDPKYMAMDKERQINVHIGNIKYRLQNSSYDKKTDNGWCFKASKVDVAVMDDIVAAIEDKKTVWFELPLLNGKSFDYYIDVDEGDELVQATNKFCEEISR